MIPLLARSHSSRCIELPRAPSAYRCDRHLFGSMQTIPGQSPTHAAKSSILSLPTDRAHHMRAQNGSHRHCLCEVHGRRYCYLHTVALVALECFVLCFFNLHTRHVNHFRNVCWGKKRAFIHLKRFVGCLFFARVRLSFGSISSFIRDVWVMWRFPLPSVGHVVFCCPHFALIHFDRTTTCLSRSHRFHDLIVRHSASFSRYIRPGFVSIRFCCFCCCFCLHPFFRSKFSLFFA